MRSRVFISYLIFWAGLFVFLSLFSPNLAHSYPSQPEQPISIFLPLVTQKYPLPRILFYAKWSSDGEIFVIDSYGQDEKQLTDDLADDSHPTWSPDGTRIAFASNRSISRILTPLLFPSGTEAYNVFLMNADGTDITQLTYFTCGYSYPDWSPDGNKIAYVSCDGGTYQIYTIDLDGQEITNLSNNHWYDSYPAWSPDGARIAYVSYRNDNSDIYIMNADGSNQKRVTYTDTDNEWSPEWSPDGKYLVYDSSGSGYSDLFIIQDDGGGVRNLTQTDEVEFSPAWSSDGEWIAFCGVTKGMMGIEKIKIDGSSRVAVTGLDGVICDPAWEP